MAKAVLAQYWNSSPPRWGGRAWAASCLVAVAVAWAAAPHASEPELPAPKLREAMLDTLTGEMERLDAVALDLRRSRPESWGETIARLKSDFANAPDAAGMVRALARLDATYPNRHCRWEVGRALKKGVRAPAPISVGFDAEWRSWEKTSFRISRVAPDWSGDAADRPSPGDELLAINGRSMGEWSREHFVFCKLPLRQQCDLRLFQALSSELLSWTREKPLSYRLRRQGRVWTVAVPVRGNRVAAASPAMDCGAHPERYPGFRLVYRGSRACVYQSEADPGTAILRITSFFYGDVPPDAPVRSPRDEVAELSPWWKEHATWRHLIVDVIDNRGGASPIPYYALLLREPFQEQYAQFRRTPEVENPRLRQRTYFYGVEEQELWFQKKVREGIWDATPIGTFLPPFPQFCVNNGRPCDEELHAPREHSFRGKVSVLMNQDCVSSCDGFVWQLQDKLGSRARFFGHPNSADPAYSRLDLEVLWNPQLPNGFRVRVRKEWERDDPTFFMGQTVVVTRATNARGDVLDGRPNELDGFVPRTLENSGYWHLEALRAALSAAGW